MPYLAQAARKAVIVGTAGDVSSLPALPQIFSQADTSLKRWILEFAARRKKAEVRNGIIRNDSLWDKLFFNKIQVRNFRKESKVKGLSFLLPMTDLPWSQCGPFACWWTAGNCYSLANGRRINWIEKGNGTQLVIEWPFALTFATLILFMYLFFKHRA